MAKKESIKALPSKVKYVVTEIGKGLTVFCKEGKIILNEGASQKELKHVYEEVNKGTSYVRIVKA